MGRHKCMFCIVTIMCVPILAVMHVFHQQLYNFKKKSMRMLSREKSLCFYWVPCFFSNQLGHLVNLSIADTEGQ
jgi:uncharacterized membrane-anchored protein